MGFLRNTANVTSAAASGTAIGLTPTHYSLWDGSDPASANWIAEGPLLDDDTGVTPVFDLQIGETLQFDIGDLQMQISPATGQSEALIEDLFGGVPAYYIIFHTGAPGTDHLQNRITALPVLAVGTVQYAST